MFQVKLRQVGELSPTNYGFIQFFNIVLRRCMEGLDLQDLNRNFFDPKVLTFLNVLV